MHDDCEKTGRDETRRDEARYYIAPAQLATLQVQGASSAIPIRRVFCFGSKNVGSAPAELDQLRAGQELPPLSHFYQKTAEDVVTRGADIPYPLATSDLTATLSVVAVVGQSLHAASLSQAAAAIYGYAVGVNFVRRDHMARPAASIATSFDSSSACGAVTPGAALPGALWMKLDGQEIQRAELTRFAWSPAAMLASLSQYFPLQPGDLVFCGGLDAVQIQRGTRLECGCDGLSNLLVRVV